MSEDPAHLVRPTVPVLRLAPRLIGTFPIVLLVFALGIGFFGWMERSDARLIAAEGVTVTATVRDKDINRRGVDEGDDYLVTFALPRGDDTQMGETKVDRGFYDTVEIGDEVTVTYVPRRPGLIDVEDGGIARAARTMTLISLAGFLGVAALIARGLLRTMSALRAARTGEVREAQVTAQRRTGSTRSGKTRPAIPSGRIAWRDAQGCTGQSLSRRMSDLSAWPEGSKIVVFVDPKSGSGWWQEDLT